MGLDGRWDDLMRGFDGSRWENLMGTLRRFANFNRLFPPTAVTWQWRYEISYLGMTFIVVHNADSYNVVHVVDDDDDDVLFEWIGNGTDSGGMHVVLAKALSGPN